MTNPTAKKLSIATDVCTFRAALPLAAKVFGKLNYARIMAGEDAKIPTEHDIKMLTLATCIEDAKPELGDIVFETVRQACDVLTGGAYGCGLEQFTIPEGFKLENSMGWEPGGHIKLTEEQAHALMHPDESRDYTPDHPLLHPDFEPCETHTWGEDPENLNQRICFRCGKTEITND